LTTGIVLRVCSIIRRIIQLGWGIRNVSRIAVEIFKGGYHKRGLGMDGRILRWIPKTDRQVVNRIFFS
jgi:hypothetical protein